MSSNNKRPRLDGEHRSSLNHGDSVSAAKPRLTRACAECKKHKIKCEVQTGHTACNKCLKSGLRCVPYNLNVTQKHMDDDANWKAHATARLDALGAAVQSLLQNNNLPELSRFECAPPPVQPSVVSPSYQNGVSPANYTSEGPVAVPEDDDDSDLIPLPMNNLYSLTEPGNSRLIRVNPADANGPDFISKGVVTVAEAEYLFSHYRDHINPLLWDGVLCPHRSLQDARRSSTLLVATVLTVAALQLPNKEQSLTATYDAFVALMRGSCLLRSQSLDDIRGLCIGAFYLTSLSWALCSRAVRVATELNLHKSSLQFSRGSSNSYERVRLWYALYVCDHQFALAYGRPPMMHEDAAVRNVEKLLSSELYTNGDARLIGQVSLFRILADAYFKYACDPDLHLGEKDFEKLRSYNLAIDQWRCDYQPKTGDSTLYRSYSAKETVLYYHFARFQLNSLSLRGISARNASQERVSTELSFDRREAANIALLAATSTLKMIVDEADLCRALVGMPIFTHAMIAVCASFLLKMAVAFGQPASHSGQIDGRIVVPRDLFRLGLTFYTEDALSLVQDLIRVLSSVAESASQRHVIRHVVTGLKELSQRFTRSEDGVNFIYSRLHQPQSTTHIDHSGNDPTLMQQSGRNDTANIRPDQFQHSGAASEAVRYIVNGSSNLNQFDNNVEDPFDLMGDLDWRFNDGFLFRMDGDGQFY